MKQTTNYQLNKPELTDSPPDITVLNENFDKIDTEMKRQDNAFLAHLEESVSSDNGAHGLKIESGTWTPYFYGDTTAGTPTYNIQSGTYYKVGNLVYINARLQLSSKGGMAGSIFIGGLPLNPSVDHNAATIGDMSSHALSKLALVANVRAVGRIEVKQYDATTITYLNDASITDNFYFMLSAIYRVNA